MNLKPLKIFIYTLKIPIKNARWENGKDFKLNKFITFVYSTIMDILDNKFHIKTVTKDFLNNVRDLIYGGYIIDHSHVTG